MKTKLRFTIALLCSIVLILSSCSPKSNTPSGSAATPEERNKAVVLQYFKEILDGEQYVLMPEVLTQGVTMHRPEGTLAYLGMVQGVFEKALSPHSMKTTIHEMVASGDYVSVRLSHVMTYSSEEAFMQSRLGRFDVRGKTVEWDAMAMFRFENGKIAEEWVSNDELGQLMQIGAVGNSGNGP